MSPRTALVTGASSGIGRALALELAKGGAQLAVCARREPELRSLAEQIRSETGGVAVTIPADLSSPEAAAEAVRHAERELGSLDLVVANAGVGFYGHAGSLRWEDVAPQIQVNVAGAMATLVAAIPIMLAQQRGHLVGVTSLAGRRGLPSAGAYSAGKAALSTFLETLRIDLARAGIRVTDVQPGFVATSMTDGARHPMPFLWSAEKAARYIARRLPRAPAVIAFPRPLVWATGLARRTPPWLYDRLLRLLAGA